MLSSTSSSDTRLPASAGWPGWSITLATFLLLCLLSEALWRSKGYLPTIDDDSEMWCNQRAAIGEGFEGIVLLGASRLQAAFSIEEFRRRYPKVPLSNLAVSGERALSTLRHLSEQTSFHGIVICSVTAMEDGNPANLNDQEYLIRAWEEGFNINRWLNGIISHSLQSNLVFLRRDASIRSVLERIAGEENSSFYIRMNQDRFVDIDYALADDDEMIRLRDHRLKRLKAETPENIKESWNATVEQLRPWVQAITDRGGMVVFLRMPTTGLLGDYMDERTPRSECFDQLASKTSAKVIHFRDIPAMNALTYPDWSHIDQRDKAAFTAALLDRLAQMGIPTTSD